MIRKILLIFIVIIYSKINSQIISDDYLQAMQSSINDNSNIPMGEIVKNVELFNIDLGDNNNFKSFLTYSSRPIWINEEESLNGVNWKNLFLGKVFRINNNYDNIINVKNDPEDDIFDIKRRLPSNISKKQLYDNPDAYTKIVTTNNNFLDFDPDKFYFDFFGYKGYFLIDNNGKPLVYCEGNNHLIVNIDSSDSGFVNKYTSPISLSEFRITDGYGNIFYFGGDYDTLDIQYDEFISSPDVSYNLSDQNESNIASQIISSNTLSVRKKYICGWSLKKVYFSNGVIAEAQFLKGDQTVFNNFLSNQSFQNKSLFPTITELDISNICVGYQRKSYVTNSSGYSIGNVSYTMRTASSYLIKPSLVKEISFRFENNIFYNIYYNYLKNSNLRYYISDIQVKYNNSVVNNIKFDYDFLGPKNEWLFLKSINVNGVVNSFEYYNTENIPRKENFVYKFTYGLDGYFETDHEMMNLETGLLKKHILPTNGYEEYFYEKHDTSKVYGMTGSLFENHKYEIIDYDYSKEEFPGMRIKKIEYNDNNKISIKNFYYKNDENKSSGIASYTNEKIYSNFSDGAYLNHSMNYNLRKIIYSKVTVENAGNGKTEYYFSDRITNPDIITMKYFDTNRNIVFKPNSREFERGKLLKKIVYSNSSKKQEVFYEYYNFISPNLKEISLDCDDCTKSDANYYIRGINQERFTSKIVDVSYVLPYPIKKIIKKDYLDNNSIIETEQQYYYNNKFNNLNFNPIKLESVSGRNKITREFIYPQDINSEDLNNLPSYNFVKDMILFNKTALPIIQTTYKNDNFVSRKQTIYSLNQGATINPIREISYYKEKNMPNLNIKIPDISLGVPDMKYDLYDSHKNLLQYTNMSGIPTTLIYGYNHLMPIAKIVGASYSEIMSAFNLNTSDSSSYLQLDIVKKSDLDFEENSKQNLLTALEVFRNNNAFKDFQITTYTYNPLIGITSINSPNGMKEFYIYNSQNKLEKVLDAEKNILKEYKYNYVNTFFYNERKSKLFIRSSCPSGYTGEGYLYVVPEYKYSSHFSQDDANQKAINDINLNGVSVANQFGACVKNNDVFTGGF